MPHKAPRLLLPRQSRQRPSHPRQRVQPGRLQHRPHPHSSLQQARCLHLPGQLPLQPPVQPPSQPNQHQQPRPQPLQPRAQPLPSPLLHPQHDQPQRQLRLLVAAVQGNKGQAPHPPAAAAAAATMAGCCIPPFQWTSACWGRGLLAQAHCCMPSLPEAAAPGPSPLPPSQEWWRNQISLWHQISHQLPPRTSLLRPQTHQQRAKPHRRLLLQSHSHRQRQTMAVPRRPCQRPLRRLPGGLSRQGSRKRLRREKRGGKSCSTSMALRYVVCLCVCAAFVSPLMLSLQVCAAAAASAAVCLRRLLHAPGVPWFVPAPLPVRGACCPTSMPPVMNTTAQLFVLVQPNIYATCHEYHCTTLCLGAWRSFLSCRCWV